MQMRVPPASSVTKSASGRGGFAYLWTLLLMAFMGVATLIASHAYQIGVQRDQERELLFIGHEFRNALQRYYEFGQHEYPLELEDLLKEKRVPNVQRYLRRIYRDPLTGKTDWVLVRLNGRIVGLHSLSDKTAIKQGNFEPDDSGFVGKAKYSEWVFVYPVNLVLPSDAKLGEEGKPAAFDNSALTSPAGGASPLAGGSSPLTGCASPVPVAGSTAGSTAVPPTPAPAPAK